MFFEAISNKFSGLYLSIPGTSLPDKTSFVAGQALQTLLWITASSVLHKHASIRLQYYCFLLPVIAGMPKLPQPIRNLACGMGIVRELNRYGYFSKKLIETSTRLQQLYFLLLTYSTATFAYDYFKIMFAHTPDETPKTPSLDTAKDTAKYCPTNFTLGLMGMSLALQLKYEPINTLAGVALGAALSGTDTVLSWMPKKYKKAGRPLKEFIKFIEKEKIFNNPESTAQKCYFVFLNWDFVSRSISSSPKALLGGIFQGHSLMAYFRTWFPEKAIHDPKEN